MQQRFFKRQRAKAAMIIYAKYAAPAASTAWLAKQALSDRVG
ncbi:hypothetical protein CAMGR0001_0482 [Campylobacter gracilis RM3268]|uniref:Uncharacterized protein n=1 Tax=Campylobacter gracilis RM3268 TaxID=553220 RepID=C8PHN5_9BACT|nr:hypothetical protein CAMGR0001_0482 [Campylobacter gracilis RM3268]